MSLYCRTVFARSAAITGERQSSRKKRANPKLASTALGTDREITILDSVVMARMQWEHMRNEQEAPDEKGFV